MTNEQTSPPPEAVTTPIVEPESHRWQRVGCYGGLTLAGASFAMAGALTAIELSPPKHIDIVGEQVAIKPTIGQDTTKLQGFVILPMHARVLGRDVGLNVSANWKSLTPTNKGARSAMKGLWEDPKPEVDRIQAAAQDYMIERGCYGALGALSLEALVGGLVLAQRRKYQGYDERRARETREHNHLWKIAGFTAGSLVVAGTIANGYAVYNHNDHRVLTGNKAFEGTPFEGAEVDGPVGLALPIIRAGIEPETTSFYDTVAANLQTALDQRPELQKSKDEVTYLITDDLQQVNGMARIVGLSAAQINADRLLYLGDWEELGSDQESYIIDKALYYANNVPTSSAAGLHDTDNVLRIEDERGIEVADNRTHIREGIRQLVLNDPRVSNLAEFGSSFHLRDSEITVDTFVQNAVEEICTNHPQLLVAHDNLLVRQIITEAITQDCPLPLAVDGRSYSFIGPHYAYSLNNKSLEFTTGSAGGHSDTNVHIGVIQSNATYAAIKVNQLTGETRYFVFTVTQDGGVNISAGIDIEVPYKEYQQTGQTTVVSAEPFSLLGDDNTTTKHPLAVVKNR